MRTAELSITHFNKEQTSNLEISACEWKAFSAVKKDVDLFPTGEMLRRNVPRHPAEVQQWL